MKDVGDVALTQFLSPAVVVLLGRPVLGMLLRTPVVSFFFSTFQIVVLAVPSGFPLFSD